MNDAALQLNEGIANHVKTLFKPDSWLAKIDFINHLVLFNNVLITILSEQSGGKTSFSRMLLSNLDQQIKALSMTVPAPCDRERILGDIAAQLHLNADSDSSVLSLVAQINERKAHVVLVIDNAQHLPESLIKEFMIAIKNQDSFGFFHLCLVSDYSVVATLNYFAADQFNNLIHTIELGSLNEQETRTYVLQRVTTECLINKPLNDSQLKQFYQLTKGNIAKINGNLDAFIAKCASQKAGSRFLTLKNISMAISAVVVAGFSYFYANGEYKLAQFWQEPVNAPIAVAVQEEPLVSYLPSFHDLSVVQLMQVALPKKQTLDDTVNEEPIANTVALVDKVIVIPSVQKKQVEHKARIAAAEVVYESQLVPLQLAPKRPAVAQVKHAAPVIHASRANRFTIQLIASHKISDVSRIKSIGQLSTAKIRRFTNAKGHWFILTLGEFNSRVEAQARINKLPAPVARLKPWIRPMTGLVNIG